MENYTRLLTEYQVLRSPEDDRSAEEILRELGYLSVIRNSGLMVCAGQEALFDEEGEFWDHAARNAQ